MKNSLCVLFIIFLGQTVKAQENLSLQEAIFQTLQNNFDILIAEKQVEIAEKNNTWSEAGLFPTVTLQVTQNNTIIDNTNNPFTFTPGVILNQGINPTLSANINLFSGFQVRASKLRLEQLELQTKGNSIVVIESTVQDVMKAYFLALLQKERMKLYESIMATSKKRLKYNEIRSEYASGNSLEVLQFKNQYLNDSTNYLLQQLSYENSLRNLMLLMNNTEDTTYSNLPVLTDSLNYALPNINPDDAYKLLYANNQNLKNQYISYELQQSVVDIQRSFLYPTLNLQLGVSPQFGRVESLSESNLGTKTQSINYFANFNLRYNIYNNWKSKRAVEVAKIQLEIAEINIDKIRQSLTINLSNQLHLYEVRNSLLNVSYENIEYAKKAYDLAQRRFELGSINSIDLLTFQSNYERTLLSHFENLYNRTDAFIDIYRSTGNFSLQYGPQ